MFWSRPSTSHQVAVLGSLCVTVLRGYNYQAHIDMDEMCDEHLRLLLSTLLQFCSKFLLFFRTRSIDIRSPSNAMRRHHHSWVHCHRRHQWSTRRIGFAISTSVRRANSAISRGNFAQTSLPTSHISRLSALQNTLNHSYPPSAFYTYFCLTYRTHTTTHPTLQTLINV